MKTLLFVLISLVIINKSYCQSEDRINEIRKIYADYNENLSQMGNFEIKYNTDGSYPTMTIYTNYDGKMLVKESDADEFGSSNSEYYFQNDTIAFIFHKSYRLTTHWNAKPVKISRVELRVYFENGKAIRTLKKEFKGDESIGEDLDMSTLNNEEIDYASNRSYFNEKIIQIVKLYHTLDAVF